ncbi:MAG: hypothetical protein COU31_03360 [Candidatus Magasanikbacteria bacterium CG10_big_fil_rev_8_21_14_0_10_40_10]|uniref:Phosphatidylglycerol--prolipoprotein diacylglyceryl transferase n=1 Tax=Candidatus Magasanikbacteria bacterium CG10_big_fil_rev_8_21_14_0_10_40_10 TaxID=1974648 RepID=A0A2M6W3K5_9BACT|nr:MAG: hypothetical protein COU31_03360 [Candidatus Magasanikbacteria bacterium CG10_big_fil_rev_8_21_14_0_10_40_10]
MIPYWQYNIIYFGPIPLQVWGVFVSVGLLSAIFFGYKLARKYLLNGDVIIDMSLWAIIGGLIMARVFHVAFYEPLYYVSNPLDFFKIWQGGASSLGGFVGAGLALWIFARLRKFKLKEILPYFDVAVLSLWLGWGIGRLGCFIIHDHIGRLSDFWLAVNFPAGARHDLGLYDSILGFSLFIVYFLLFKKLAKIQWGLITVFSVMDYAIARFMLDFLRVGDEFPGGDARYYHLTPAQWGMLVIFFGLGLTFVWLWYKLKVQKNG